MRLAAIFFLSLAWLAMPRPALGAPVTEQDAGTVAAHWLTELKGTTFTAASTPALAKSAKFSGANNYYIVNLQPSGFAVISGEDTVQPVLSYSDTGQIDLRPLPPEFQHVLDGMSSVIDQVRVDKSAATADIAAQWTDLRSAGFGTGQNGQKAAINKDTIDKDVAPMTNVTWNQDTYYNTLCPAARPTSDGPDGHVYVGCVAIAMAQIMAYHRWPQQGTGSHSYSYPPYGTLSANFGATTYNWGATASLLTNYNTAVEMICFHCGVAVNMMYGGDSADGSGAYPEDAATALKTYFGYGNDLQFVNRAGHSDSTWMSMLHTDLDNSRPIFYGGQDPTYGGHAWVLDGYQGTSYFHTNWGWGGYANGYFLLSGMGPAPYNFSDYQSAILNIHPSGTPAPTPTPTATPVGGGTGQLRVTITPSSITSGVTSTGKDAAVWHRVGDSDTQWFASGTTILDVPVGPVTIAYSAGKHTDYNTPVNNTVTVSQGATTNYTANFSLIPQVGSLRVLLTPGQVVVNAGYWRRTGTDTWLVSGHTESNVPTGNTTVEYYQIPGNQWIAPPSQTVPIGLGQSITLTGAYEHTNAVAPHTWALFQ